MNAAGHSPATATTGAKSSLEAYYRFHARIYDLTRWTFLFGRSRILDLIANDGAGSPRRILELGCGTGRNLAELARRFPDAELTGVDLSAEMLARATVKTASCASRVRCVHRAYDAPLDEKRGFDLVLFSYALSMFNPGFETAISAARRDLAPGGRIAAVDFHDTRFSAFERWMRANHVRMNGQLRPLLQTGFVPLIDRVSAAYGGVWRYLTFVGRVRQDAPFP